MQRGVAGKAAGGEGRGAGPAGEARGAGWAWVRSGLEGDDMRHAKCETRRQKWGGHWGRWRVMRRASVCGEGESWHQGLARLGCVRMT